MQSTQVSTSDPVGYKMLEKRAQIELYAMLYYGVAAARYPGTSQRESPSVPQHVG